MPLSRLQNCQIYSENVQIYLKKTPCRRKAHCECQNLLLNAKKCSGQNNDYCVLWSLADLAILDCANRIALQFLVTGIRIMYATGLWAREEEIEKQYWIKTCLDYEYY